MKFFTFIICLLMSSFVYSKIERPEKSDTGHKNINKRKEYRYSPYPGEDIWHEFGRPFWKAKKVVKMPVAKPVPMVVNNVIKAETKKLNKQVKIDLGVFFASSESIIEKNYFNQLDQIAEKLKQNNNIKLELRGHTDSTGSRALNELLSNERSKAIKNYLITKHGISSDRLKTKGFALIYP